MRTLVFKPALLSQSVCVEALQKQMETVVLTCSNQFLSQEPGTNEEIKKFARDKGFKGVLMDKVDVNGPKASPVYNFLKV